MVLDMVIKNNVNNNVFVKLLVVFPHSKIVSTKKTMATWYVIQESHFLNTAFNE